MIIDFADVPRRLVLRTAELIVQAPRLACRCHEFRSFQTVLDETMRRQSEKSGKPRE